MIRVTILLDTQGPNEQGTPLEFRDHDELDVAVASGRTGERELTPHEIGLLQAVAKSLPEEIVGLVEVVASKGMFQLAWKRLPEG